MAPLMGAIVVSKEDAASGLAGVFDHAGRDAGEALAQQARRARPRKGRVNPLIPTSDYAPLEGAFVVSKEDAASGLAGVELYFITIILLRCTPSPFAMTE